ncbi:MAG: VanZ family protein [Chitinophagales bacterium]|nr:VanZ family protein [Chitinophagales bacterium]
MWEVFTKTSPYKKRARILAISWTLLIFILCFLPGDELPDVDIPFIDKWAHILLFAGFSFFWLLAEPTRRPTSLLFLLFITVFVGWLVEYIQGHYVEGRTQDNMDTLADTVGGFVGIIMFTVLSFVAIKNTADK